MTRALMAAVALTALAHFHSECMAQGAIKVNSSFSGKLAGTTVTINDGRSRAVDAYRAKIPVTLKAGHSVTITASVVGDMREILIALEDPDGMPLGKSPWGRQTNTLEIKSVNDDGTFSITIASNLKGPFELLVSDDRAAALESEINTLKERLQQLEAELAAIRKKK